MTPAALLLKLTWAPGFLLCGAACWVLAAHADDGPAAATGLGASAARRLNLGLAGVELGYAVLFSRAMASGLAAADAASASNLAGSRAPDAARSSRQAHRHSNDCAAMAPPWPATGALLVVLALAAIAKADDEMVGCFRNVVWEDGSRPFSVLVAKQSDMTPTLCGALARTRGVAAYALEYGEECWLDGSGASLANLTRLPPTHDTACDMPCTGDANITCGGNWHVNVYSIAGPVAAVNLTAPPGAVEELGCVSDSNDRRMRLLWRSTDMTHELCRSIAYAERWGLFALQAGNECFGANNLTRATSLGNSTGCNEICAGNSTQDCGGRFANLLRAFDPPPVAAPPSDVLFLLSSSDAALVPGSSGNGTSVNGTGAGDGDVSVPTPARNGAAGMVGEAAAAATAAGGDEAAAAGAGASRAAEAALSVVLMHSAVARHQRLVCKLLATSRALRAAAPELLVGRVPLACTVVSDRAAPAGEAARHAQRLCAWLRRFGRVGGELAVRCAVPCCPAGDDGRELLARVSELLDALASAGPLRLAALEACACQPSLAAGLGARGATGLTRLDLHAHGGTGELGLDGLGAACAALPGLRALSVCADRDSAAERCRVNAALPGLAALTQLTRLSLDALAPPCRGAEVWPHLPASLVELDVLVTSEWCGDRGEEELEVEQPLLEVEDWAGFDAGGGAQLAASLGAMELGQEQPPAQAAQPPHQPPQQAAEAGGGGAWSGDGGAPAQPQLAALTRLTRLTWAARTLAVDEPPILLGPGTATPPSLRSLTTTNLDTVALLLEQSPALERLELTATTTPAEELERLTALSALSEVALAHRTSAEAALAAARAWAVLPLRSLGLNVLDLEGFGPPEHTLSAALLGCLARASALTRLELESLTADPALPRPAAALARVLRGLTGLRALTLGSRRALGLHEGLPELLGAAARLPRLKRLRVALPGLGEPVAMEALCGATRLATLGVDGPALGRAQLLQLAARLPQLRRLRLRLAEPLGDADVAALADGLTELTSLELTLPQPGNGGGGGGGGGASDAGWRRLARVPGLHVVELHGAAPSAQRAARGYW
ncbi:WSC domain-containing protein [Scenedesmus sp. PABB004]|nr:WSC domain-containing protein [Scenedesmus sp. PABB004]